MAHTLELAILVIDIYRVRPADYLKFSKKRSDQYCKMVLMSFTTHVNMGKWGENRISTFQTYSTVFIPELELV